MTTSAFAVRSAAVVTYGNRLATASTVAMASSTFASENTASCESSGVDDNDSFRLGYVTDVEGNLDYFLRYVEQSKVLRIDESSSPSATSTNSSTLKSVFLDLVGDNTYFVFGGDAVDKGPGDIRLVRALVGLKKRYPERVFLLVGNRDLNKLRFTAELSEEDMARDLHEIPPPHWDPKAPSILEYLQNKQNKLREGKGVHKTIEKLNTRVHRLQYLLKHTLGCPETFEFRRQELALLREVFELHITDEDVVESFLFEVADPEGSLRQYMEVADVAIVLGNTLFCHGAVDTNTMKFVPRDDSKFENPASKPPAGAMIQNVHDWTRALNKYLKKGLADHLQRPLWNEDRTSRGGESLMALQNRPAMWGRSIVSNCYGDGGVITTEHANLIRTNPERVAQEATNPMIFEAISSDPLDTSVANWLHEQGIQRIVVGHKPTGDCPAVLSAIYHGVEIVSADTSYSDSGAKDNRGKALAIVELVGGSIDDNHLELRGSLHNEVHYSSIFPRLHQGILDTSVGDSRLGCRIQHQNQDYWIKVATEDSYWLARGKGRQVEHRIVNKKEITLG